MTFNDEGLARAVAACPVPVITGIGHEPDTSICDMVSDRRCSTPTAAAESVAPALDEIVQVIDGRRQRLGVSMARILEVGEASVETLGTSAARAMSQRIASERQHVEGLAAHRCLQDPTWMLSDRETQLMQSEQRLHDAMPRILERGAADVHREAMRLEGVGDRLLRPYEAGIARMAASLDALSPLKVLGRGYAIARDAKGHVIVDAAQVSEGDEIEVRLGRGEVVATVTGTRPDVRR